MTRRLSHPVVAGAIVLLLVNDHLLKQAWPGWATGKLSDVAGMIFFPVLLAALCRRERIVEACIATVIVFALVKTVPAANEAYRVVWGAMYWPLRALRALAHHAPLPPLAKVSLARDPTDLIALPFVWLAWRFGRLQGVSAMQKPGFDQQCPVTQ